MPELMEHVTCQESVWIDLTKAKRQLEEKCATPATQNEGGCEVLPRLPCKVPRRRRRRGRLSQAQPSAMSATPAAKR